MKKVLKNIKQIFRLVFRLKDPYDNSDKDINYYFQIKDDIKTFDDLTKFFNEKNLLYGSHNSYIFRGESNYSGKLQPKLFRKDKNTNEYFIDSYDSGGGTSTNTKYGELVLKMFHSISDLYKTLDIMGRYDFPNELTKIDSLNFENKRDINDFIIKNADLIGFAQHNGLPTLALDFTYDFKSALYFSLTGDFNDNRFEDNSNENWECKWIKNDSCLWVMNLTMFSDINRIKNRPINRSRLQNYIHPLIQTDLSYKNNKNALSQNALSVLCLDTRDYDIIDFEDFCVFEELHGNCKMDSQGIELNGAHFMGATKPLIYKILIPPSLKIEIAEKMHYFRNFNFWHSNNNIIENIKISKKLYEICEVDRLYKYDSTRPSLDETFCEN